MKNEDLYLRSILISLYEFQNYDSLENSWVFVTDDQLFSKRNKRCEKALEQLENKNLLIKKDNKYQLNESKIENVKELIAPYFLLKGTRDSDKEKVNNHDRIEFLINLLNNSHSKMELIENLRWKNFNFSVILFAALFVLHFQLYNPILISISLSIVMILFFLYDNRLHKFVHGHRMTIKNLTQKITNVINMPSKDIIFWSYYVKGELEAKVERYTTRRLIYIYFIIISIITCILKLLFSDSKIFNALNLLSYGA